MPRAWSAKRERQYEHILEGLEDQGRSRTKAQLYEEAKKLNIEGRSSMSKAELEKAVGR